MGRPRGVKLLLPWLTLMCVAFVQFSTKNVQPSTHCYRQCHVFDQKISNGQWSKYEPGPWQGVLWILLAYLSPELFYKIGVRGLWNLQTYCNVGWMPWRGDRKEVTNYLLAGLLLYCLHTMAYYFGFDIYVHGIITLTCLAFVNHVPTVFLLIVTTIGATDAVNLQPYSPLCNRTEYTTLFILSIGVFLWAKFLNMVFGLLNNNYGGRLTRIIPCTYLVVGLYVVALITPCQAMEIQNPSDYVAYYVFAWLVVILIGLLIGIYHTIQDIRYYYNRVQNNRQNFQIQMVPNRYIGILCILMFCIMPGECIQIVPSEQIYSIYQSYQFVFEHPILFVIPLQITLGVALGALDFKRQFFRSVLRTIVQPIMYCGFGFGLYDLVLILMALVAVKINYLTRAISIVSLVFVAILSPTSLTTLPAISLIETATHKDNDQKLSCSFLQIQTKGMGFASAFGLFLSILNPMNPLQALVNMTISLTGLNWYYNPQSDDIWTLFVTNSKLGWTYFVSTMQRFTFSRFDVVQVQQSDYTNDGIIEKGEFIHHSNTKFPKRWPTQTHYYQLPNGRWCNIAEYKGICKYGLNELDENRPMSKRFQIIEDDLPFPRTFGPVFLALCNATLYYCGFTIYLAIAVSVGLIVICQFVLPTGHLKKTFSKEKRDHDLLDKKWSELAAPSSPPSDIVTVSTQPTVIENNQYSDYEMRAKSRWRCWRPKQRTAYIDITNHGQKRSKFFQKVVAEQPFSDSDEDIPQEKEQFYQHIYRHDFADDGIERYKNDFCRKNQLEKNVQIYRKKSPFSKQIFSIPTEFLTRGHVDVAEAVNLSVTQPVKKICSAVKQSFIKQQNAPQMVADYASEQTAFTTSHVVTPQMAQSRNLHKAVCDESFDSNFIPIQPSTSTYKPEVVKPKPFKPKFGKFVKLDKEAPGPLITTVVIEGQQYVQSISKKHEIPCYSVILNVNGNTVLSPTVCQIILKKQVERNIYYSSIEDLKKHIKTLGTDVPDKPMMQSPIYYNDSEKTWPSTVSRRTCSQREYFQRQLQLPSETIADKLKRLRVNFHPKQQEWNRLLYQVTNRFENYLQCPIYFCEKAIQFGHIFFGLLTLFNNYFTVLFYIYLWVYIFATGANGATTTNKLANVLGGESGWQLFFSTLYTPDVVAARRELAGIISPESAKELKQWEVEKLYNWASNHISCGFACQLESIFIYGYTTAVTILTITIFIAYAIYIYRFFKNKIVFFLSILTITASLCFSWNMVLLCVITITIYNLMTWKSNQHCAIDLVTILSIHAPWMVIITFWDFITDWFGFHLILTQSNYMFTVAHLGYAIFLCGFSAGVIWFIEFRKSEWGRATIVIEKDENGRLISRKVHQGLLGRLLIGSVGDGVIIPSGMVIEQCAQFWQANQQVIERFGGMGDDGEPTQRFVTSIITNATKQGTIETLIKTMNEAKELPCSVMQPLKATIFPQQMGILKQKEQSIANAWLCQIGGTDYVITNCHAVCDPSCMQELFVNKADDKFVSRSDLTYVTQDNGEDIQPIKVLAFDALADIAICELLNETTWASNGIRGFKVGPYITGKNYIWCGTAPPLDDPQQRFYYSVMTAPRGQVYHTPSEKGDSGSILIDNMGNCVAMKWGILLGSGETISNLGYFIPTAPLGKLSKAIKQQQKINLDVQKIHASKILGKQLLEDENQVQFLRQYLANTDETFDQIQKCIKTKDIEQLNKLLEEIGNDSAQIKSLQKFLNGKVLVQKGRRLLVENKNAENDEVKRLKDEMAKVKFEIKGLQALISDPYEVKTPADKLLKDQIDLAKQKLKELEEQWQNTHHESEERKRICQKLGQLGQRKHQLQLEIDVLVGDEMPPLEEVQKLKEQLKVCNEVSGKIAQLLSQGKTGIEELLDDTLAASRMPENLKQIRYPLWYQDPDTKKFNTYISDTQVYVTDKHPAFSPEVMALANEMGHTESQWRKRIQRSGVSYQWYHQTKQQLDKLQASGLKDTIKYMVKRIIYGPELCLRQIVCPDCGKRIVCDKVEHKDCSDYLCKQLERHLTFCTGNIGKDEILVINGLIYTVDGNVICNDHGQKCGKHKNPDHQCFRSKFESDDKFQQKKSHYFQVGLKDGTFLYVLKTCVEDLRKLRKAELAPCDDSLKEIQTSVKQLGDVFDDRLKGFDVNITKTFDEVFSRLHYLENQPTFKPDSASLDSTKTELMLQELLRATQENQKMIKQMATIEDVKKYVQQSISEVQMPNKSCLSRTASDTNLGNRVTFDESLNTIESIKDHLLNKPETPKPNKIRPEGVLDWSTVEWHTPMEPPKSWNDTFNEMKAQRDKFKQKLEAKASSRKKALSDTEGESDSDRKTKRKSKKQPKVDSSSGDDNENRDRLQLFFSNRNGFHDTLVTDCHCPKCQCEPGCECAICAGTYCLWCNKTDHSTCSCDFAKDKKCTGCNKNLPNWWSDTFTKFGDTPVQQVCCMKHETCGVCMSNGHHPLACPVLFHTTLTANPLLKDVNTAGLPPTLLKSLLVPMVTRNAGPSNAGGRRNQQPQKKEKKSRVF